MAQSSATAQRFDPYKNFKFRVKWDGRYVAGVSKVGTEYDAITLEQGVTHDPEFEMWANKVWNFGSGPGAEVSLKDFRKDVIIRDLQRSRTARAGVQGLPLLGVGVSGCARSGRMPTRSRFSTSSSRTKGSSATTTWSSRRNPPSGSRRRRLLRGVDRCGSGRLHHCAA